VAGCEVTSRAVVAAAAAAAQVDKSLNVLEFHEKPPKKVLATMSIDTWEYGFGEFTMTA
jgi:hypothetical protein